MLMVGPGVAAVKSRLRPNVQIRGKIVWCSAYCGGWRSSMVEQMDTKRLARLIRETNTRLDLLVSQLNVAQMNQPGAVGVWSVKDVLAHVAFWEQYVVGILRAIARGETPDLTAADETEARNASV